MDEVKKWPYFIEWYPERKVMKFPSKVDFNELREAFNIRIIYMNKSKNWQEFFDRCNGKHKEAKKPRDTSTNKLLKKILDSKSLKVLEKHKSKIKKQHYLYVKSLLSQAELDK